MLGLFAVMATASGCLFFLDASTLAQSTGLSAVGVLLMLLNVAYIVVMAVLIVKQGARHVHGWAVWIRDLSLHALAALQLQQLLRWKLCQAAKSSHRIQATQVTPTPSMQLSNARFARALSWKLSSWSLDAAQFLPEAISSRTS